MKNTYNEIPTVDPRHVGHVHSLSQAINMLEILDGIEYPASKMDLIAYADSNGASEEVLDELQCIEDDIYNSIDDVNDKMGLIEPIEGQENLWSSAPSQDLPQDEDYIIADISGSGRL